MVTSNAFVSTIGDVIKGFGFQEVQILGSQTDVQLSFYESAIPQLMFASAQRMLEEKVDTLYFERNINGSFMRIFLDDLRREHHVNLFSYDQNGFHSSFDVINHHTVPDYIALQTGSVSSEKGLQIMVRVYNNLVEFIAQRNKSELMQLFQKGWSEGKLTTDEQIRTAELINSPLYLKGSCSACFETIEPAIYDTKVCKFHSEITVDDILRIRL